MDKWLRTTMSEHSWWHRHGHHLEQHHERTTPWANIHDDIDMDKWLRTRTTMREPHQAIIGYNWWHLHGCSSTNTNHHERTIMMTSAWLQSCERQRTNMREPHHERTFMMTSTWPPPGTTPWENHTMSEHSWWHLHGCSSANGNEHPPKRERPRTRTNTRL